MKTSIGNEGIRRRKGTKNDPLVSSLFIAVSDLIACYPNLFNFIFCLLSISFIIVWSLTKPEMDLRRHDCSLATAATAIAAFTITFSSFSSLLFYVNWAVCFVSSLGTREYRDQTLALARKFWFLLVLGINQAVSLIPKVPPVRDTRSQSYLLGVAAFMLALTIVNLGCLRTCLQGLHAWQNGKVILMVFVLFAMSLLAIVQDNGTDKVEEDYDMNIWFFGLFGVLSGFIFSLLGDWFFREKPRRTILAIGDIELQQNLTGAEIRNSGTGVGSSILPAAAHARPQ
jgi:hypothetical protein